MQKMQKMLTNKWEKAPYFLLLPLPLIFLESVRRSNRTKISVTFLLNIGTMKNLHSTSTLVSNQRLSKNQEKQKNLCEEIITTISKASLSLDSS